MEQGGLARPCSSGLAGVPLIFFDRGGATLGWERWLGAEGVAIGLDRFGASGPAETLFEQFGFTVANVVRTVKGLLGRR